MDHTQNKTVVYSKQYWAERFRSYSLIDTLYIFILTPLSLIGIFSCILSFQILKKKCFNSTIYTYFRVYLINSITICIIFSIKGSILSEHSYLTRLFDLRMLLPIFAMVYYLNSLLDVYLSLKRLSYFLPKLKIIRKLNPYLVSSVLLTISIFMNSAYSLTYMPGVKEVQLDSNTKYKIYFVKLSKFGASKLGKLNAYLIYVSRDLLTSIVVVFLNALTILFLKKHLKQNFTFLRIEKNSLRIKEINKSITNMVLVMSFVSSIEHVIVFISYFYFAFSDDLYISTLFNFISCISIVLKQISNFFIFLAFNDLFRNKLKQMFYIKRHTLNSQNRSYNNV